jgi:multicomponent Na+:H+ antiporter subunit F
VVVVNVTRIAIEVVMFIYIASLFMYIARLIKGPTLFDKVLAVNAFSYDLMMFMALIAIYTENPYMASPMVLVALWAFALDMYISKIVEYGDIGE